jgi:enterobacterial common antigen flippase
MPDEPAAAFAGGATPAHAVPVQAQSPRRHSYREILKSSAVIGGSSAINICIGIARTKVMALLLGPAGYGLMGAYTMIADLTRSVAQMGLNASGVRQIADAAASGDTERIARTATALRYASLVCAVCGAAALVGFSGTVSQFTFGTDRHAGSIALLSVAVFLTILAGSQGALLQGMRRIADMARLTVLGSLLGTLVGIPTVYFFGIDGLVPTLIVVAAGSLAASWWYSRRVSMAAPRLDIAEIAGEAAALLRLGLAFMASGLLVTGAAYLARTIVLRQAGLEAAGVFYAAWTLGGLYIGFVLQALGADFYPRLVGVIQNDEECNRLVNEQAQVSLLLAIPGILATLTFAPLVITLLYSRQFEPAVDVLRWLCLGMALRVLTWPIGSIVVAKNRQLLFFGIDFAWALVNVGLTWWLVDMAGVNGAGIAFFVSYVFHGLVVYPVARRLTGFRWTRANFKTTAYCFSVIGAVFIGFQKLPPALALGFGALWTLVCTFISARVLITLIAPDRLPRPLRFLRPAEGARP